MLWRVRRSLQVRQRANVVVETVRKSNEIFGGFISGKILDSAIIGVIAYIVLAIMKMPDTMLVAVIIGVTNIIPFFGPYIGAVPSALIVLTVSPIQCIYFLIFILVLQQFDGLYLGPKILGDSTGLRPAWIIFSVSAGGVVCGVLGMFRGVPVVAVIGHLINIWINYRLEKRNVKVQDDSAAPGQLS